jgi:hypothetical protein
MGQPGAKEKVRAIYPSACLQKTKENLFPMKVEWHVYYKFISKSTAIYHYGLGYGKTGKQAWSAAWKKIQEEMIAQLES